VSLRSIVNHQGWNKLIAIDPASHSLACAIIDNQKNVLATGKIVLSKQKDSYEY
jgi:hypothetical protein